MSHRTEPCACAGFITVDTPATDRMVLGAVVRHRWTPQHQAWSGYNDLQRGPLVRPGLVAAAEAVALAIALGLRKPELAR